MASIQDLPDEIILEVISYLEIEDQLRCGGVSKRIRKISHDESLRKKAYGLVAENTVFNINYSSNKYSMVQNSA